MANIPTVFVSSTCYDLGQIRKDISHFIEEELGYSALLSEKSSFPVNPDADTINNCRQVVKEHADIFVLIIGGRYGSIDKDTTKSITNLEYLTARAQQIPIYAFIDKRILAILPVWKKNKMGDFSEQVDSTKVFDFINNIKSEGALWTHEFESAQDIITTLRFQFATLTKDGLKTRLQLKNRKDIDKLDLLSAKAFRIALEQPIAWEYRLFGQTLIDAIDQYGDIRREHKSGIVLGSSEYVSPEYFSTWVKDRTNETGRVVQAIGQLIGTDIQTAMGEPGQPGDPVEISFVTRKLGLAYQELIQWSQRLKRTRVDPDYEPVVKSMSAFNNQLIEELEEFGSRTLNTIEKVLIEIQKGNPQVVELCFNMELFNLDDFNEKWSILQTKLGY